MYQLVSKLILYRELGEDSILGNLSEIFRRFDSCHYREDELITDIYREIKRLLDLSTDYAFEKNLWHNYLTFILMTNENSFTLTCEKNGAQEGTVNHFAKNDFKIFMDLFNYDFSQIEDRLGIDCFSTILHYNSIGKKESMYNVNVSEKVHKLSEKLEQAKDVDEFFEDMNEFYKAYGVGMFGLNKAFRLSYSGEDVDLIPIKDVSKVRLDDLTGYEIQKKKLIDNTEAFVHGRPANNCLLYGDAGTGKSTSIKAILNQYYDDGLRMVEIYKHQFKDLATVISSIKNRNYRFIIYMDDLSFEEFETDYKYLKAVIEGGIETRPENVLIYATSNRRHLIKETWGDRDDRDEELHRSDSMQEKLSLVARFGVTINYSKPDQKGYFEIVKNLAKAHPEITMDEKTLCEEANKWELKHGGMSGRTAQQFIDYVLGQIK
ncbi:MAG: ATP-binding protein [Lachnospiraceae bacterium]|nr:ATP-binding protein [Lachnospiraceae bacterium]